MKDQLTANELKRNLLIAELRDALNAGTATDDGVVLWLCGLTEATLATDLAERAVPWEALRLHYYILAKRALAARAAGRLPDGATFRQRIATLQAQVARKVRREK